MINADIKLKIQRLSEASPPKIPLGSLELDYSRKGEIGVLIRKPHPAGSPRTPVGRIIRKRFISLGSYGKPEAKTTTLPMMSLNAVRKGGAKYVIDAMSPVLNYDLGGKQVWVTPKTYSDPERLK